MNEKYVAFIHGPFGGRMAWTSNLPNRMDVNYICDRGHLSTFTYIRHLDKYGGVFYVPDGVDDIDREILAFCTSMFK